MSRHRDNHVQQESLQDPVQMTATTDAPLQVGGVASSMYNCNRVLLVNRTLTCVMQRESGVLTSLTDQEPRIVHRVRNEEANFILM